MSVTYPVITTGCMSMSVWPELCAHHPTTKIDFQHVHSLSSANVQTSAWLLSPDCSLWFVMQCILIIPTEKLNIFSSVTSSSAYFLFVSTTISKPYIIGVSLLSCKPSLWLLLPSCHKLPVTFISIHSFLPQLSSSPLGWLTPDT